VWLQSPAAVVGPVGKVNSVVAAMSKTEHHEVVCPHIGPVNVFIQVSLSLSLSVCVSIQTWVIRTGAMFATYECDVLKL